MYIKGKDYNDPNASHTVYGITKVNSSVHHFNMIEVFGDEKLRDEIIELLNESKEE